MLRSFDYASRYVLTERAASEMAQLVPLARAWDAHNRQAFLEGYLDVDGIRDLLPGPELGPGRAARLRARQGPLRARLRAGPPPGLGTAPAGGHQPSARRKRMMPPSSQELQLIARGHHGDPHRVLGRHGDVVRAYRPDAAAMRLITGPPAHDRRRST